MTQPDLSAVAGMILLIFGFFSPVVAIACAVFFYVRNPKRRIPPIAYALILLVCGIIAYVIGMVGGISWACSSPSSANLCGLMGIFLIGPIAAALAIFFVSASIMVLQRDGSPTVASRFEFGNSDTGDEKAVPVDATSKVSSVCSKLWRGQYSLSRSFWGFFVLGTCIALVVGIIVNIFVRFMSIYYGYTLWFIFAPYTILIYRLGFLAYLITAALGVWRSANAIANNAQHSKTFFDSGKIIAAKSFVVLTTLFLAIGGYVEVAMRQMLHRL